VAREALVRLVGEPCRFDDLIADLIHELRGRPDDLTLVAGGYALRTKTRFAPAIRAAHPGLGRDDEVEIGGGATVWLHPADHWSARGVADRRMALWCGYVIATRVGAVYVAGDTGYGDGRIFLESAEQRPVIDVAILPIGAYAPRWFMKDQHVNPAEAVRIMQDCGARQALGVHWGTFPLTDEARSDPADALAEALAGAGIEPGRFLPLEPGQQWDCPTEPAASSDKFTTRS
jgi:L-ascorbate metabolism protein UlaG (beta-lactamase superfamily)